MAKKVRDAMTEHPRTLTSDATILIGAPPKETLNVLALATFVR